MQTGIDYTALFYEVTRQQLREYRRRTRPTGWFRTPRPWLLVIGVALVLVPGAMLFWPVIKTFIEDSPNMALLIAIVTFLEDPSNKELGATVIVLSPILGISFLMMSRGTPLRTLESRFRYDAFARANGLLYWPDGQGSNYPGVGFQAVDAASFSDTLRPASGSELDISNLYYGTSERRGYMAIRLSRKLPHIILDSRQNGTLFLPGYLPKNQVLSLEGDFNEYFTLYCPREYERDALYIFTPDLMTLLIDHAAPFDVEIVDDWMFVYSSEPFTATDPGVYHRLFQIVATVGKKALSQTARYSDERVNDFAANLVETSGQRLRIKWQLGLIVFVVLMLLAIVAIIVISVIIDSRYK